MKRAITRRRTTQVARCIAAAVLAVCSVAAHAAVVEGRTSEGHRYVVGGIGAEEVEAIQQEAPAFSLQVVTAARTGAYLSGAHVRITGPGNDVVLDTTLDGPWLLVDLPGGRYTVRTTHSGNTVERQLTIASGRPQRVLVHFDAPVDTEQPARAPEATRPAQ